MTLPVTGGGMLGVVTEERGLVELLRGVEGRRIAVAARSGGAPLPAGMGLSGALGRWARTVPLAGGGRLLERGLLPDLPAPVLQWTLEAGTSLPLEVVVGEGGAEVRAELVLAPGATAAVAFLPAGPEGDGQLSLLRPLAARELQRQGRNREDRGSSFGLQLAPAEGPPLAPSLGILDDSALGVDRQGRPEGPFLMGLDDRRPRFLRGEELAEAGLAALLTGRGELAHAMLVRLARTDDGGSASPLAFLHLAARWALWTGDAPALLPLRGVLEHAAAALTAAAPDGRSAEGAGGRPAALPAPARVLELLADGVEPLGEVGWRDRLLDQARRAGGPPQRAGLALPVLGPPGSAAAGAPDPSSPLLPPPRSFGPPDAAAFLHRRTLQAARLLRSWVEGELGAEGEAARGRLHLSPRLPGGLRDLKLQGLALGDARISLDCRVREGTCTFRLLQESGRVPVNVIFGPELPLRAIDRVRLGGEDVEVDVEASDRGTRVRCQFPLDPERRLTVDGTA